MDCISGAYKQWEKEANANPMEKVKKIWNAVTTVLIVAAVVLAALLWGSRLIGMDVFVVQSGSMEPEYHVGSLVYVKEADAGTLDVGDVITFQLSGDTLGTHRIIEVVYEDGEPAFRTKGDANDHEDNGLVTPAEIVGEVKFSIPYLGYLVVYIQGSPGKYVAIAAAAVLLLLVLLPDLLFDDKNEKKQEETT